MRGTPGLEEEGEDEEEENGTKKKGKKHPTKNSEINETILACAISVSDVSF